MIPCLNLTSLLIFFPPSPHKKKRKKKRTQTSFYSVASKTHISSSVTDLFDTRDFDILFGCRSFLLCQGRTQYIFLHNTMEMLRWSFSKYLRKECTKAEYICLFIHRYYLIQFVLYISTFICSCNGEASC